MNKFRQALRDKTTIETLKMQEMAEDFEVTMEDDTFNSNSAPQWLSTVLGVGGSLLSLSKTASQNPGIGVALGLVSTVIDSAVDDEEERESLSLAGIKSQLADMFESSVDGLDQIARIAVGRPWDEDRYGMLPNFGNTNSESAVANFYNHAFWLLDNDSEPVSKVIDSTMEFLRIHIVDSILQGLGYAIIWDPSIKDKEECSRPSRKWLNIANKNRCFKLAAEGKAGYVEVPEDSDLFDKMKKWGLNDIDQYFKASIDCAKSQCDTVQSVGPDIAGDQDVPLCFYSAPVKRIDTYEQGKCDASTLIGCERTQILDFWEDSVKSSCPN